MTYSRDGKVVERLEFDLSDNSGMEDAIARFKNKPKAVLEKKLLAEYLRGDVGAWRPVEMVRMNLRNQHEAEGEVELLKGIRPLTLTEAIQLLKREDISVPGEGTNKVHGQKEQPTDREPESDSPLSLLEPRQNALLPRFGFLNHRKEEAL